MITFSHGRAFGWEVDEFCLTLRDRTRASRCKLQARGFGLYILIARITQRSNELPQEDISSLWSSAHEQKGLSRGRGMSS